MFAIGTKITQAFLNAATGQESIIPGVIVDQTVGKADGANGPVGPIYNVVSLETARPEKGGHTYLGFRNPLTTSWSLAPRVENVPELDDYASVDELVAAAYTSRQEAHLRMIRERAAALPVVDATALPF